MSLPWRPVMRVLDLGRLARPNWPMPSASSSCRSAGRVAMVVVAAAGAVDGGGAMVDVQQSELTKKHSFRCRLCESEIMASKWRSVEYRLIGDHPNSSIPSPVPCVGPMCGVIFHLPGANQDSNYFETPRAHVLRCSAHDASSKIWDWSEFAHDIPLSLQNQNGFFYGIRQPKNCILNSRVCR